MPTGVQAIAKDITERKQMEKGLREAFPHRVLRQGTVSRTTPNATVQVNTLPWSK